MKTIIIIISSALLIVISFVSGVFYESPKLSVHHELEDKYSVLQLYGSWTQNEMKLKASATPTTPTEYVGTRSYKDPILGIKTTETSLFKNRQMGADYYSCEDGSRPDFHQYSAFGNKKYTYGLIGGSFDGYFYSLNILDCGVNYFVLSKDGRNERFFGPFVK